MEVVITEYLSIAGDNLGVAYPVKPADWDAELTRIEAKLTEPGRLKVLALARPFLDKTLANA